MSEDISNAVAIVGIACKFPKSNNLEDYWENIKNGTECLETLSQEELEQAGIDAATIQNKNYVKRSSYIEDVDKFDADFFKISPKEAIYMDPQQRLLLEKAWEAMEDAGYIPDNGNQKVAVFASTSASNYFLQGIQDDSRFVEDAGGMQALLHGLDKDHIATKIAYKLNCTGPTMTVQSACSSSMVGTIMACQSLLTYQADLALAGGVTINVPQKTGYMYEKGSILSQDGYCRPFDESANGTVFGSGVACLALKRLEDAIEDNDRIYSVIKGFALNNDGSDKVGYTAPSVSGQMEVIGDALDFAQVDAATISYLETHGTGTIMGDPIEVEAVSQVYESYTEKKQFCALGSIKANMGHLNVASGIAGIIKGALITKNRLLPPMVNLTKENTKINFKDSPFYINKEGIDYTQKKPLRAAVSSFGIGGTNGHIILEEYIKPIQKRTGKSYYCLPLSARNDEDLRQMCQNLVNYLSQHPEVNLADVERTLQQGRKSFNVRKVFLAKDIRDFICGIEQFLNEGLSKTEQISCLSVSLVEPEICSDLELLSEENSLFADLYNKVKSNLTKVWADDMGNETVVSSDILAEQLAAISFLKELGVDLEVSIHNLEERGDSNILKLRKTIADYLGLSDDKVRDSNEVLMSVSSYLDCLTIIKNWSEAGNHLDWQKLIQQEKQNIISLPTYPFKRNSYWYVSSQTEGKEIPKIAVQVKTKQEHQHVRPQLKTAYKSSENELEERLVHIWEDLLGISGLGVEDDFFELGGHSLMGTQLTAAVKDEFLIDLEMDDLFDCSTVSKLAKLVEKRLKELIESMDDQEVDRLLRIEEEK